MNHFLMEINDRNDYLFDFQFELSSILDKCHSIDKLTDFRCVKHFGMLPFKENIIPVGSVEFVTKYIKQFYNKEVRPINIPEELMHTDFTGRKVELVKNGDVIEKEKFVKSATKFKQPVYYTKERETATEAKIVSDIIDITSEFRVFISNKEIVGIKHYSGNFFDCPPSEKFINGCIEAYTMQPRVWTLDIGKNKENEFVIECHDFFSCGLYGFRSLRLPTMFSQWFYNYVRSNL